MCTLLQYRTVSYPNIHPGEVANGGRHHPAALDRALLSTNGVRIHGSFGEEGGVGLASVVTMSLRDIGSV